MSVSVLVSWFRHIYFCCGVHRFYYNSFPSPPFLSFNHKCAKTRDGWDDVKLIAGLIGSPIPRKSRCARNTSGVMSFSMEPPVTEKKAKGFSAHSNGRMTAKSGRKKQPAFLTVLLSPSFATHDITSVSEHLMFSPLPSYIG